MAGKRRKAKKDFVARHAAEPPKLSPGAAWHRLLLARIHELDAAIPSTVTGTVQFEVARGDGSAELFHVQLDDAGRGGATGLAAEPDAWIETTEQEIGAFLRKEAVTGALRVVGDVGLAARLFTALAQAPRKGSPLAVRLSK